MFHLNNDVNIAILRILHPSYRTENSQSQDTELRTKNPFKLGQFIYTVLKY